MEKKLNYTAEVINQLLEKINNLTVNQNSLFGGIVVNQSVPIEDKNYFYITKNSGVFSNFGITIDNDGKSCWSLIYYDESLSSYKSETLTYTTDEIDNIIQNKISGNVGDTRPTFNEGENIGFQFFDKRLGKYICWDGYYWINLDGSKLVEE